MIDVHQHVNWLGQDDTGLIAFLDRSGADKCWLQSWESVDGGLLMNYQHLSIEEIERTYRKHPKRVIPFCGIDPRRKDAEKMLADCHKRGFKGYGELKFRVLADDPDLIRMLRLAGKLRMPALFHLDIDFPNDHRWYGGDISHLDNATRLCPQTVIIGHGPGFWREISGDAEGVEEIYPKGKVKPGGRLIKFLEKYPNAYADLSANSAITAMSRDLNLTRRLLTKFRKKLLYGCDCYETKLINFLRSLNLDKEVFRDITERNAKRLIPA